MKLLRFRWSALMLVVLLALLPAANVGAEMPNQTMTGMGPDEAMSPGDWAPIVAGERHWFAFNYDGDGNSVKINMYAKPTNGATFKVMTPAQADHWRRTGEIQFVGAGSYNQAVHSEMFWTGEFKKSGTYYVVVEHSKLSREAAWCKLSITGKGVTFPTESINPVPAVIAPQPGLGVGPELAYLPGEYQELREGMRNWFAFTYDKHAVNPMIEIRMYAKHTEGLIFKIMTPEQVALWRTTGKIEWIGAGFKDAASSADLSWKGSFTTSGVYYVVVEHSKSGGETAYGKLLITGEGVSF